LGKAPVVIPEGRGTEEIKSQEGKSSFESGWGPIHEPRNQNGKDNGRGMKDATPLLKVWVQEVVLNLT